MLFWGACNLCRENGVALDKDCGACVRSLVKKDAGMLDAFGKGASEDIRAAKAELYAQMTWDPLTAQSLNTPPQITTPMPSPPPSPETDSGLHKANSGAATILLVPVCSYHSVLSEAAMCILDAESGRATAV